MSDTHTTLPQIDLFVRKQNHSLYNVVVQRNVKRRAVEKKTG